MPEHALCPGDDCIRVVIPFCEFCAGDKCWHCPKHGLYHRCPGYLDAQESRPKGGGPPPLRS